MREDEDGPGDVIAFWFPDGADPTEEEHLRLWSWRMRGGAHEAVLARFSGLTERAASGALDHWAETPEGRLALILILDQFTRSVWAGTARAFSCDAKARELCLEGIANGHFDALVNVWQKAAFKIPLEHCECPDHLVNLDLAIAIADRLAGEAPEGLRQAYAMGAGQPRLHRAVIERFGRHPHRNALLRRESTAEEQAYLATGDFPHTTRISLPGSDT
ncbi:MAG: DUF924 family protein [Paracoccaceae bacterium]